MDNQANIWFIRHGESFKNLAGIHGGKGNVLTEKGIHQCNEIVSILKLTPDLKTPPLIVVHDVQQVIATGKIFAKAFDSRILHDERIKGINLGVANGLSRQELGLKFPVSHSNLEKWRAREISMEELEVTGMENAQSFFERINEFIQDYSSGRFGQTIIVPCTTSVMIMIINLTILGKSFSSSQYFHYHVGNCDFLKVRAVEGWHIESVDSSVMWG